MNRFRCPNCGSERPRGETAPKSSNVCPACGARPREELDDGELALEPLLEAPRPSSATASAATQTHGPSSAANRSESDLPPVAFFGTPYVVVLVATTLVLCCCCPLSLFFEAPRGVCMLWGIGLIFGGFLWFGFRFKRHTGDDMTDEAPWYLRGGLAMMMQVTGYVIQEPVVFGPPFSLVVLGGVFCLSPIWLPEGRWSWSTPVAPSPPPPAAVAETPSSTNTAPPSLPPSPPASSPATPAVSANSDRTSPAELTSVPAALRDRPFAFLTDLEAFDIQGPIGMGRHGNLGDGNAIVARGQASPKGIGMHPPDPPLRAVARWRLDRAAGILRGGVALNDSAAMPWGAARFTVSGDGNTLWTSPPVKKRGEVVEFEVDVRNIEVLELSVQVEGLAHYVHAVWIEPRLERKSAE